MTSVPSAFISQSTYRGFPNHVGGKVGGRLAGRVRRRRSGGTAFTPGKWNNFMGRGLNLFQHLRQHAGGSVRHRRRVGIPIHVKPVRVQGPRHHRTHRRFYA
jgi:hypothetical protein